MLSVYIDFKSPASYLALEPTLALAAETGVTIKWLPFSSRLLKIPAEQADETVGDRHRRVRAIAQRNTHLHYAQVQGREMEFADIPPGSDAALAALAVLEGDPVPFIRATFKNYWTAGADLNDQTKVQQILSIFGHDNLNWSAATAKLQSIREEAEEQPIFETPTYIIHDQVFLGREHLPWIKSIIANS